MTILRILASNLQTRYGMQNSARGGKTISMIGACAAAVSADVVARQAERQHFPLVASGVQVSDFCCLLIICMSEGSQSDSGLVMPHSLRFVERDLSSVLCSFATRSLV
jgi:hypothetical protein